MREETGMAWMGSREISTKLLVHSFFHSLLYRSRRKNDLVVTLSDLDIYMRLERAKAREKTEKSSQLLTASLARTVSESLWN